MEHSDSTFFLTDDPLRRQLILVMAPSEASFRIVEKTLARLPRVDVRWHSQTIETLADIFMAKPHLLLIFGDSNQEGLDFLRLVRNNPQFRDLPVYMVLPEPERLMQRLKRQGFQIQLIFTTPVDHALLYKSTASLLGLST